MGEWLTDLFTLEHLFAFITLTALEIVLGIDNIVFIAILVGKLPPEKRDYARKLGLALAIGSRLVLLLSIGLVVNYLTTPLFSVGHSHFSFKELILIGGGIFLVAKASYEIHHRVSHAGPAGGAAAKGPVHATLQSVLVQVIILDIVFSLDSVITAVGLTSNPNNTTAGAIIQFIIMGAAVVVAVGVMLVFSGYIVSFVDRNPSIKILALSFLLLIGVLLVAEGFHQEISKGYVYFAMAFALVVDLLQLRADRHHAHGKPVTNV